MLLREHLRNYNNRDVERPDFEKSITAVSFVKAVFPTAPLSRMYRIAVAFEFCEPNTQMVRVPWMPQVDNHTITARYNKFLQSGRDLDKPDDAEYFRRQI